MSKKLIVNYRYISTIYANGTVFITFDYFTYDFKVNETHFFNFYFLEYDWFHPAFLKWDNLFSVFYKSNNYIFTFSEIFNNSFDSESIIFFFNNTISLKKKINTLLFDRSFFKKQSCFLRNSISIYNNLYILEILKKNYKKYIYNIFFNFL